MTTKQLKPFSFWNSKPLKPSKLVKIKPGKPNLFFQPKFTQPVNIKLYPKRTMQEIRLIDKKPFGDRDKDRVPNFFDCKPMNRKKQGRAILAIESAGMDLFGHKPSKTLSPILKQVYNKELKKRQEILEGIRFLEKSKKINLETQNKQFTEWDVAKFFAMHPEHLKKARRVDWMMGAIGNVYSINQHGKIERVGGRFVPSYAKPDMIKIMENIKVLEKKMNNDNSIKEDTKLNALTFDDMVNILKKNPEKSVIMLSPIKEERREKKNVEWQTDPKTEHQIKIIGGKGLKDRIAALHELGHEQDYRNNPKKLKQNLSEREGREGRVEIEIMADRYLEEWMEKSKRLREKKEHVPEVIESLPKKITEYEPSKNAVEYENKYPLNKPFNKKELRMKSLLEQEKRGEDMKERREYLATVQDLDEQSPSEDIIEDLIENDSTTIEENKNKKDVETPDDTSGDSTYEIPEDSTDEAKDEK
jgi:hypothetical protein